MQTVVEKLGGEWRVVLRQGNQSFIISYPASSKKEAEWMAKQFKHALTLHNQEVMLAHTSNKTI